MKTTVRPTDPVARVLGALLGLAFACSAAAGYQYTYIDYPGVNYANGDLTQVFGINDEGLVVGSAYFNSTSTTVPFTYDYSTGVFTVLPNYGTTSTSYTSALGIDDSGVVVGGESTDGGTVESAFILRNGAFTIANDPGATFLTEFRGVGRYGLVSGWADSNAGTTFSCFLYDPAQNHFDNFLTSSEQCIAQGISANGAVVGGVHLEAGQAHPGSPAGFYGFRREMGGALKYFRVNASDTKARGINDAGYVTGYAGASSFVVWLGRGTGFEGFGIPAARLLSFPGAEETYAEAISNSGVVAGNVIDAAGAEHGFLAAYTEDDPR
jgi:uncharacterized membrane protein